MTKCFDEVRRIVMQSMTWKSRSEQAESSPFADAQRIVMRGTRWGTARHIMVHFRSGSPLHLLNQLLAMNGPSKSGEGESRPEFQVSIGLTRRGLERLDVPRHVMACFAQKAPAFWAGAAVRAASHLGMSGTNAAECWDSRFDYMTLDAVLSVHAADRKTLENAIEGIKTIRALAKDKGTRLRIRSLPWADALDPPNGVSLSKDAAGNPARGQWVHFGFLDGLSRIEIKVKAKVNGRQQRDLNHLLPGSRHEAGEFLLGHVANCGADTWVRTPGLPVWPDKLRAFFRNGSFGVLHQIQQNVGAFEKGVAILAEERHVTAEQVKGLLCGRYPDGRSLAHADRAGSAAGHDFDYADDPAGSQCPFGSHVRRMNPRLPHTNPNEAPLDTLAAKSPPRRPSDQELQNRPAHLGRARPLLRRGMPYGAQWTDERSPDAKAPRGLIGHFFCASVEDQFEHLVGEWADRLPIGIQGNRAARDPMIGAHESAAGAFEMLQPTASETGKLNKELKDLGPLTQTKGIAYLFYPSLATLKGIAQNRFWRPKECEDDEGDEDDEDEGTHA